MCWRVQLSRGRPHRRTASPTRCCRTAGTPRQQQQLRGTAAAAPAPEWCAPLSRAGQSLWFCRCGSACVCRANISGLAQSSRSRSHGSESDGRGSADSHDRLAPLHLFYRAGPPRPLLLASFEGAAPAAASGGGGGSQHSLSPIVSGSVSSQQGAPSVGRCNCYSCWLVPGAGPGGTVTVSGNCGQFSRIIGNAAAAAAAATHDNHCTNGMFLCGPSLCNYGIHKDWRRPRRS